MNTPDVSQHPTAAEQDMLSAARASRERCLCGEVHDDGDGITPALVARIRGYLAANPGHQIAYDDEAGIVAVIIARDPGPPEVLAWSGCLVGLLDDIGAPPAAGLS